MSAKIKEPAGPISPITRIIVVTLMLWMILVITTAQRKITPTFDEQNHVTRGIAILRCRDYRLCLAHPPLANILQALPVVRRQDIRFSIEELGTVWTEAQIWMVARQVIWRDPQVGVETIRQARLPVLLFTLSLGLLVFLWSADLFGMHGGLLTLTLYALDPTILAHSGLATTDIAAACTIVLALYLLRRHLLYPSRARLLLTGAGVGLALATKYTGLLLVPMIALILPGAALCPVPKSAGAGTTQAGRASRQHVFQALFTGGIIALCAGFIVWGIYGFAVEPIGARPVKTMSSGISQAGRLPIPAPQYLRGAIAVKAGLADHRTYLLGKSDHTGRGWWYYYPVAFAAKTPLPALVLILGILAALTAPRLRDSIALPPLEAWLLLAPIGVYLAAALGLLGCSLDLGLRLILPIYPLLYILAGAWIKLPIARAKAFTAGLALLLLLQLVSVAVAYPDFISYFNEFSGGEKNGWRVIVDSNYDWGQDLWRLAEFQRSHPDEPLAISYFGTTPPEACGITAYRPVGGLGLMRQAPPLDLNGFKGFFAISITNLAGGGAYTGGADYRALLDTEPYARLGNTIFVYRLPMFSTTMPN